MEEPKRKSTSECIDELRKSLDILNANVTSLRSDMQATAQQSVLRSQLDNIKSDIASVKGILLNRYFLFTFILLTSIGSATRNESASETPLTEYIVLYDATGRSCIARKCCQWPEVHYSFA